MKATGHYWARSRRAPDSLPSIVYVAGEWAWFIGEWDGYPLEHVEFFSGVIEPPEEVKAFVAMRARSYNL